MSDSVVSYDGPPLDAPPEGAAEPEPFGQLGVRQYFGRIFRVTCVVICIFSFGLAQRSALYNDRLQWTSGGQALSIRSANGALVIHASDWVKRTSWFSGWLYYTDRSRQDEWPASMWKRVGFEMGIDRGVDGARGFWIGMKWSLIILLAAIQPIVTLSMAFVRRLLYRE